MLSARNLGRRLSDRAGGWLFRGLSLDLFAGEILTLSGPTGSGKTLLLRALAGLDPPQEGEILLSGLPQQRWDMPEFRSRVTYLHQTPALLGITVEDDLREAFGYAVRRDGPYEESAALVLVRRTGRDESFLRQETVGLSGGERQLVAIIRALLVQPDVLLLDEPTAALDPDTSRSFEDLVTGWMGESSRRGILWVSHDRSQAARLGDRRLHLSDGHLRAA